jgi:hypothetical protein
MRVFVSFQHEGKKRTKTIDDVKTQWEAESKVKEDFPGASINYTDVVENGQDGTLFGKGMLMVS